MPLQGTLLADFDSFTNAVAQAQTSLSGFETGATKVESALTRMTTSMEGTRIVQQATLAAQAIEDIGGATKLTTTELAKWSAVASEAAAKLSAMGQDVPPKLQALADATKANADATGSWDAVLSTLEGTFGALSLQRVIDQVVELGKAVLEDASQLENLQARTGINVETLQQLRTVGAETGVSLDAMANTINKLQKNIGGGSPSTVSALADLKIAFQDIKTMSPEEAYFKVIDALKDFQDQNEKVAIGTALMGKTFAETLPAVNKGFDEARDHAAGMSAGTVQVLHDAEESAHKFYQGVKDSLGEALANELTGTTEEVRRLAGEFANLDKQMAGPAAAMKNYWGEILPPSVPKDLDTIIEKSDAWAKESKAIAAAMVELNSAGQGWKGTLDTIDGTVVEAIKYYLDAGVSQKALADTYALTEVQVKAVASAMKDATEQVKALAKAQADADAIHMASYASTVKSLEAVEAANQKTTSGYQAQIDLLSRLDAAEQTLAKSVYEQTTSEKDRMKILQDAGAQHEAIVNKQIALDEKQKGVVNAAVLAELDAQTKLNAAYGLTASGGIAQETTAYTKMTEALDALHLKKVEGVDQTQQENVIYKTYTDALLEAAKAEDAETQALGKKNDALDASTAKLQAATQAMQTYQGGEKLPGSTETTAFGTTYIVSPTGARVPLGPHGEVPKNFDDLYSGKSNFPEFAGGVSNFGGGFAIVGEQGPELVNLPSGSSVLPNGMGGGTSVVNHIYVNGTAADVARQVAAEIMRSLRSTSQLPLR